MRCFYSSTVACLLFATWLISSARGDPPQVWQLVDQLLDDEVAQQEEAANALAVIVEQAEGGIYALERLLQSPSLDVRFAAARVLRVVRRETKDLLPVLEEALKSDDAEIREQAAEALGKIGPDAAATVPSLREALKDRIADVRIDAALALGEVGENVAIPDLVNALEDEGSSSTSSSLGTMTVRIAAGLALRKIGPEAVEAVAPHFGHEKKEIRILAMFVLAGGEEASRPYIPMLLRAMKEEDVEIRQAAAEILGEVRIAPLKTVPALAKLLTDDNHNVRYWTTASLARYGEKAASAVPQLIKSLSDQNPGVRAGAADALGQIGPMAKEALPELHRLTEDESFFHRFHALQDSVAPHAKRAIEKITGQSAEGDD